MLLQSCFKCALVFLYLFNIICLLTLYYNRVHLQTYEVFRKPIYILNILYCQAQLWLAMQAACKAIPKLHPHLLFSIFTPRINAEHVGKCCYKSYDYSSFRWILVGSQSNCDLHEFHWQSLTSGYLECFFFFLSKSV